MERAGRAKGELRPREVEARGVGVVANTRPDQNQSWDETVAHLYPWMLRYARLMLGGGDAPHEAIRAALVALGDQGSLDSAQPVSDRLVQLLIVRCREHALRRPAVPHEKSPDERGNRAIIAALPPIYRQILELRDCDNLSFNEIARLTGLRQLTLRKRDSRARQLLLRLQESGADSSP